MSFGNGQLDLPLAGAALPLPQGASLWIVAGGRDEVRHIRAHLLAAAHGERGAFLVREGDGTTPIGPECVVGVHDGGDLHLFAPPGLASPDLPRLVVKAFSLVPPSAPGGFEDLLLVRLWGNGGPTTEGSQADGPLGLALSRLQTSDMRRNPFLCRSLSSLLLDRLDGEAPTALRAMLRRSWSASVLEATGRMEGRADAALATAMEALRLAAGEFGQAGLDAHAEKCASDADSLATLLRAVDGSQPFLPGLSPPPAPAPSLPRTAFRSFRCIGLRVPCPVLADAPAADASPRSRPNVLVDCGTVRLRDLRLGAVLGTTSYPGLVPRVRTLSAHAGGGARIRVWLDEEHKALLGLPIGTQVGAHGASYTMSVLARGRPLDPPFRSIRRGRSAEFHHRSELPARLTVRIYSDGRLTDFPVVVP